MFYHRTIGTEQFDSKVLERNDRQRYVYTGPEVSMIEYYCTVQPETGEIATIGSHDKPFVIDVTRFPRTTGTTKRNALLVTAAGVVAIIVGVGAAKSGGHGKQPPTSPPQQGGGSVTH
jgi:hypothetical protein